MWDSNKWRREIHKATCLTSGSPEKITSNDDDDDDDDDIIINDYFVSENLM